MSNQIKQQLKNIKDCNEPISPSEDWVKENRSRLLSQISNTVNPKEKQPVADNFLLFLEIFFPKKLFLATRPIAILFVVLSLTIGGWLVKASASNSTPNNSLMWSVKLATEKIQLTLTPDESKPKLKMEFGERRVEEAKKEIDSHSLNSKENASKAIKELKKTVESVKEDIHNVGKNNPEKSVEVAKEVSDKTEKLADNLKGMAQVLGDGDLQKEVTETKKTLGDVAINAIETAIKAQGDNTEVKNLVQDKIESIVKDTEDNKKVVEDVKNNVATIASSTTSTVEQIKDSVDKVLENINSLTTTTPRVIPDIDKTDLAPSEVVQKMTELKDKVGATNEIVKKETEAVKQMVDDNKLTEAIDKMKELKTISDQATTAVVEVKTTVESVTGNMVVPSVAVPVVPTTSTVKVNTTTK